MEYLIGFVVGLVVYRVFEKTLMVLVRAHFGSSESRIRKDLFSKMSYEDLAKFSRALEIEFTKRRAPQ